VRALKVIGANPKVVYEPFDVEHTQMVLLPGVGAYGKASFALSERKLRTSIERFADTGRLLVGICLGMQLLYMRGEEFGSHKGLELLDGEVKKIPETVSGTNISLRLPLIGWKHLNGSSVHESLANSLGFQQASFYFVHSYRAVDYESETLVATTEYGGHLIPSIVKKNNIIGCQFHPERSGEPGLRLLKNIFQL